VPTDRPPFRTERLVPVRLAGQVVQAAANAVIRPDGRLTVLPGQGGVVLGIGPGDLAGGWVSDHLEPGASLRHPDEAANRALQTFACLGNRATVIDGPAAGAIGYVVGKHGAVITAFADAALARIAPGEWVAIEARGVGVTIDDEPDVAVHSCDPGLLELVVPGRSPDGRLRVEAVAQLPAAAAAAGIGMPAAMFNLDLEVEPPEIAAFAAGLRFGDVVVLRDQDHRFGRQHRAGWLVLGIVAHGSSASGGHGLGMVTLVTGPADRFEVSIDSGATISDWSTL
jgi:hypothetical protein